jgi:hypothetical protein
MMETTKEWPDAVRVEEKDLVVYVRKKNLVIYLMCSIGVSTNMTEPICLKCFSELKYMDGLVVCEACNRIIEYEEMIQMLLEQNLLEQKSVTKG